MTTTIFSLKILIKIHHKVNNIFLLTILIILSKLLTEQSVIKKKELIMPKIVDKEEKKRAILSAAIKVFSEKGISDTRMIDIADYAGVGKGTLYEYFSSKEDIFEEGFLFWLNEMETEISKQILEVSDPRQKLRIFITTNVATFEENADLAGIMFDFWAMGLRKDKDRQASLIKSIYENYIETLSQFIEEGIDEGRFRTVDSRNLASCIVGALDGILLQWIIFGENFPLEETVNTFVDVILGGISINEC
jgi:TetR/AcrR family fatty acid metabolism transcriptional regulator